MGNFAANTARSCFAPVAADVAGLRPCPVTCLRLCLAGLTSAMYMKGDQAVPNPDPQAGLYVRGRQGAEVTQASIPADHIAFQMGEAMQVRRMSAGPATACHAPLTDVTATVDRYAPVCLPFQACWR